MISKQDLWDRYRLERIGQCVIDMECNGFKIDTDLCAQKEGYARGALGGVAERLNSWAQGTGYTPGPKLWSSTQQLATYLHGHLGLPKSPIEKRGKVRDGKIALDGTALDWIRSRAPAEHKKMIGLIAEHRKLSGTISTLAGLPEHVAPDGFVHPVTGPAGDGDDRVGAITGRLAPKKPAINIAREASKDPLKIRQVFVAPQGFALVCADYSALEVVVMADLLKLLFGDNQLAEAVAPGAPDIHGVNARKVFGSLGYEVGGRRVTDYPVEDFKTMPELTALRDIVKMVAYRLAYGGGAYGLGIALRGSDGESIGEDRAKEIMNAYLDSIPGIRRLHLWVEEFVRKYRGIIGPGGRWCDLGYLMDGERWHVSRAYRIAHNFPMQERGAAIVGAAMVINDDDLELRRAGLLLERQVHDELDWRIPAENLDKTILERINHNMVSAGTAVGMTVSLQVTIKTGSNWHECK